MAANAPMIEFDGHTYIMVPQETGRLVQPGNAHILSRREVEAVVAKLERYERTNNEAANAKKLEAYRQLLAGGQAPAAPAKKEK